MLDHRRQHVEKQPDALLDAQIVALAILVDGLAPHIFQEEVRLAIAFDTGIQRVRAEGAAFETGREIATDRVFEKLAVGEVCDLRQAGSDVRGLLRRALFEIREPGLARAGRQLHCLIEQRTDLAPASCERAHFRSQRNSLVHS